MNCRTLIVFALSAFTCVFQSAAQQDCTVEKQLARKISDLTQLYEQRLGFYKNPFMLAFSIEEADGIYESLLTRASGILCTDSPLFKMYRETNLPAGLQSATANNALLSELVLDAERLMASPRATRQDLQSNLLALESAQTYVQRFCNELDVAENTEDSTHQDSPKDVDKPQPDDDKNVQNKEHADAEFEDDYSTGSKHNDPSENNEENKKYVVAETNVPTRYFGAITYTDIARNRVKSWKVDRAFCAKALFAKIPATMKSDSYLKVATKGKKNIPLYMPSSWSPGQPKSNGSLMHDGRGGYRLEVTHPTNTITIPLYAFVPGSLSTYEKNMLTKPVGYAYNDWPESIRTFLDQYTREDYTDAAIAKNLAQYISNTFLYTKSNSQIDPLVSLDMGTFRCDMASLIMVSILRDNYKVPSRIVSGVRAKKKSGSVNRFYIEPEEKHAWTEVFHDGSWHVYDPTPLKKAPGEPEDDTDGTKESDYQDASAEDSNPSEQSTDTHTDQPNHDNAQSATKSTERRNSTSDDSERKVEPSAHNETAPSNRTSTLPELDESLKDLSFDRFPENNPLKALALKALIEDALNPLMNGRDAIQKLTACKEFFASKKDDYFINALDRALDYHNNLHEPLIDWLKSIDKNLFSQDITSTYQDLQRMIKILNVSSRYAGNNQIKELTRKIIYELNNALDILWPLRDIDAGDLALAEDFKKSSPAMIWKFLQSEYKLTDIGRNAPTNGLIKDLKDGKHEGLRLLNALYPYSNFMLNASTKSGTAEVKTWQRDSRKVGRDFMPLQRYDEMNRALYTKPHLSISDSIAQGSAYVLARRARITIEASKHFTQAERITILGYDTSASMTSDSLDQFQATLIAAFVSRALSDISPSGKARHRVILVPFDDKVGIPYKVSTIEEAFNLIRNHRDVLSNTGGGTDIQEFLLQAMKLIAQAQDNKQPFQSANIIVMSDGGSAINLDELKKARQSINRETPLQAMFIALGGTNEALKQFSTDSQKMGMENGFYHEFSHAEIQKFIRNSRKVRPKDYEDYYYTSLDASMVPQETKKHISDALHELKKLAELLHESLHVRDLTSSMRDLKNHHAQEIFNARPLETWVYEVRGLLAKNKIFHDKALLTTILSRIMDTYEFAAHISRKDLTHHETEQLLHLLERPTST